MKDPAERKTAWDTLVLKLGEDGAKAEMKRRSSLVKKYNAPFRDKEFARKAQKLSIKAKLAKKKLL